MWFPAFPALNKSKISEASKTGDAHEKKIYPIQFLYFINMGTVDVNLLLGQSMCIKFISCKNDMDIQVFYCCSIFQY